MGGKNKKRISEGELFDGVLWVACKLPCLPDVPYAILCNYDGRDNKVNTYYKCD